MLMLQAQNQQIKDYAEILQTSKADDMTYDKETNTLQLQSLGMPIGNPVVIDECNIEDGVPVVDFTTITPDDSNKETDNVVEF